MTPMTGPAALLAPPGAAFQDSASRPIETAEFAPPDFRNVLAGAAMETVSAGDGVPVDADLLKGSSLGADDAAPAFVWLADFGQARTAAEAAISDAVAGNIDEPPSSKPLTPAVANASTATLAAAPPGTKTSSSPTQIQGSGGGDRLPSDPGPAPVSVESKSVNGEALQRPAPLIQAKPAAPASPPLSPDSRVSGALESIGEQVQPSLRSSGEPAAQGSQVSAAPATANTATPAPLVIREQIVAAIVSRREESRLEIALDPPELGRIAIEFEGNRNGLIRVVLAAESPDTADLLRRNLDLFQQMLERQGLSGLDLQMRDKGRNFVAHYGDWFADAGPAMTDGDTPGRPSAKRYILENRLDRLL